MRTAAIAALAVALFCFGGAAGWVLRPPVATARLNCRTQPQPFVSNTPGVIVEPVMLCWKAP